MLPHLIKLKGAALDLFFPQNCLGCGKEGDILCCNCMKSLPRIVYPVCPKCGRPQSSNIVCPHCISWNSNIDNIRSPLKFTGVTREAIHQFKYKNIRSLVKPLAKILSEYWNEYSSPIEVIIPVPLHSKRLKERGYNQSSLLSKEFGRLTDLPVKEEYLTRNKYILPQVKTHSLDERVKNVEESFICRHSLPDKIKVLLVDDVSTSGATFDACAKALKLAGASSVYGLALAKEI